MIPGLNEIVNLDIALIHFDLKASLLSFKEKTVKLRVSTLSEETDAIKLYS